MDHSLRSISYIADIDHILVVMAKRSLVTVSADDSPSQTPKQQQKLICHIFETDEVSQPTIKPLIIAWPWLQALCQTI